MIRIVSVLAFALLSISVPAQPPQYQLNTPGATISIDNAVVQNPQGPGAITQVCVNQTAIGRTNGTLVGFPHDILVGGGPLAPRFLATAGGQVVNINLAGPSVWVNGGPAPLWLPFFPFTAGMTSAQGTTVTAQMIIGDPGHADGFRLSQASQLNVIPGGNGLPGPTGDDTFVTISLSDPAICAPGSFPFAGTTYTQFHVISNGRVMFGPANWTYTSSPALALSQSASVGFWTDLNPSTGGNINVQSVGGQIRINWNAVRYFSDTATVTYSIVLDTQTGDVLIDGLQGIQPSAATSFVSPQWLGLSPGSPNATDPGSVLFSPGATGIPANVTDAVYDFWDGLSAPNGINKVASLQTGVATIQFLPFSSGYIWLAQ
jgi:hypothetical protein